MMRSGRAVWSAAKSRPRNGGRLVRKMPAPEPGAVMMPRASSRPSGLSRASASERNRPAGEIDTASYRIDPNDLGTHLRHRHAAERCSDKGRDLDDPKVLEEPVHRVILPLSAPYDKQQPVARLSPTILSIEITLDLKSRRSDLCSC